MKTLRLAIGFLFLVLVACHRPVETRHGTSLQPELAAIDTLMQTRPDSALTLLLDEPINDPFYQLLLSEALYKNDYAQANRTELLTAMTHFDSIDDPILSARCHYMNGVGYYEMDSVVSACAEYLKALEIMEEHFEEKDLVGYKAKFMALSFAHLCDLFSDQYLNEQAIGLGKSSVSYFKKYDSKPWHISWILKKIGSNYDMLGNMDSAGYYYNQALILLPDTNSLMYRDIEALRTLLFYHTGKNPQMVLKQLRVLLSLSESNTEYLSRCLVIGDVFYNESQFDSAWRYLNKVFNESTRIGSRKQAAEWLAEICKLQGMNHEKYADFLVPFANQEENKSRWKSQLTELYSLYIQQRQNRLYITETRLHTKWSALFFGVLIVVIIIISIFYLGNKRRKIILEAQIIEERKVLKAGQKAIGGKLKKSNEALRAQKKENAALIQELRSHQSQVKWGCMDDFMNENACQEILSLLHGVYIKRNAKIDDHPELRLGDVQLSKLEVAVEKVFPGFIKNMVERYSRISRDEINQCLLCLLNLKDVQIAALMYNDYSTIKKRSAKLKKAFGTEKTLQIFLRSLVL